MTFFKWDQPKKRVRVERIGDHRVILQVDVSESMRIMEAKIAKMTPEEIASNEAESDQLEAEFEAEEAAENAADAGLAEAQRELQLINEAITAHNLACRTCDTMAGKKSCAEGTQLRQRRKEAKQVADAALAQLH
jgi:hypothetical protein